MAFDWGFWKVVVEEGVVFEFGEFEFAGMEIECLLEYSEGFLFIEEPDRQEVADLQDEAAGFLHQRCLSFKEMLGKNNRILLGRKVSAQLGNDLFWIPRQLTERTCQLMRIRNAVIEDDEIEG